MKRLLTLALATCLVGSAFAQGAFTIRRPVDGSKVREIVSVRIPKNSLVDGAYLGIFIDDKFVEAVLPDIEGDDYVYKLDTKARKLADGEHKIEVVQYVPFENGPRITNRTSVSVIVDNYTSIPVPEDGFDLRYKFVKGQEMIYNDEERQSISLISQALAQVGGRAGERVLDVENIRYMFAVDNVYQTKTGIEALLRVQALPWKGRDYAIFTASGEAEPRKFYSHEMHPIYTRYTAKGREVETGVPFYVPMDGTSGDSFRSDLYKLDALPVLPDRRIKPGEPFPSVFMVPTVTLDKINESYKMMTPIPARGTFESVEWQDGIPVAKLRIIAAQGQENLAGLKNLNAIEGEATRLEMETIVWFDLNKGRVIRAETSTTQEALVDVNVGGTGGPAGGGAGNAPGVSGGPSTGRGPAEGGGRGGRGDGGTRGGRMNGTENFFLNTSWVYKPFIGTDGTLRFFQNEAGAAPGALGGGQGGTATPGGGGGGFGQAGGGGATQTVRQVLRIRQSIITTLEQVR